MQGEKDAKDEVKHMQRHKMQEAKCSLCQKSLTCVAPLCPARSAAASTTLPGKNSRKNSRC